MMRDVRGTGETTAENFDYINDSYAVRRCRASFSLRDTPPADETTESS